MKLFVCCMIIIVNISDNGKASLDSFTPANTNLLLEDTTKNSDKSCNRPCKFNVKPRRCYYSFKVEPKIMEDGRSAIVINGMSPGPSINACVNDVIVVEVQNKVPGQDIALHWHGVEQKGSPYMDGVPMITQCPIGYGFTYKYAFLASAPGTFFYHADSVLHQSDGMHGSLVVNQPQPLEPHASLYDYDRSDEHTLIFAARFPELMTNNLENLSELRPNDLVINYGDTKLFVMPGFAYRLRLINAVTMECPVAVTIDKHEMMIIASDGRPVKPVASKKVVLYPGERMDVVVRAGQESGGYWIHARGSGACAGLHTNAMFLYSGFNYTSMLHDEQDFVSGATPDSEGVFGQMLESLQEDTHKSNVKKVYLAIDGHVPKYRLGELDFTYISDRLPRKPYYPAVLALQPGIVQINEKNFLYPSMPVLLNPDILTSDITCAVGEEKENKDLQCLQVLNVEDDEVLELVLINEGFGSNDSFTFHMHGYGMHVLETRTHMTGGILQKEFEELDKAGKIKRNLRSPVIKDTVTVSNSGYTIVRIKPDHGGSWLLECRSCAFSLPAAILINVPQPIPKLVLDSLPKCGNYKPPDVLLN